MASLKSQESIASMSERKSRVSVKSRRMSTLSSGGGGRSSIAWRFNNKTGFKVPKYQNTYRLEPYLPFQCAVSDKILAYVMTKTLEDMKYNPYDCLALCKSMAIEVRNRLYKTDFDRVKYVVTMTIIENSNQSLYCMDGKLWDSVRDTYSVFVYENISLFAAGTVVALYYE